MANTPKYARVTAKRHAEALRKGGANSALGEKTTASTKDWPKRFPTQEDQRVASYVPRYASRNAEFGQGSSN